MSGHRVLAGIVLAGALLAGCSSSGPEAVTTTKPATSTTAPEGTSTTTKTGPEPCTEVFADGATTSKELTDTSCLDEDGDETLMGTATLDCEDGRTLRYNNEGWGYDGEPWHRHAAGEETAPEAEQSTCAYG